MTKKKRLITIVAAGLFSLMIGVSSGFSAEGGTSGHGSGHHGIESGRDFGQHVKDHNDRFSGDHNPGKHHKGYSGIK